MLLRGRRDDGTDLKVRLSFFRRGFGGPVLVCSGVAAMRLLGCARNDGGWGAGWCLCGLVAIDGFVLRRFLAAARNDGSLRLGMTGVCGAECRQSALRVRW